MTKRKDTIEGPELLTVLVAEVSALLEKVGHADAILTALAIALENGQERDPEGFWTDGARILRDAAEDFQDSTEGRPWTEVTNARAKVTPFEGKTGPSRHFRGRP